MITEETVRNCARTFVLVLMDTLLSSSAFKPLLNSFDGKWRSASATSARVFNSGELSSVAAPASSTSTILSSCSATARSDMGALQLSPQVLDGSMLKLFYGTL